MENESDNYFNEYSSEAAPSGASPDPNVTPKKKARKKHPGLRAFVLVLVCILLGGAAGIGGSVFMHNYYINHSEANIAAGRVASIIEGNRNTAAVQTVNIDTGTLMTGAQVYAANVASTVGIKTSISTTNFWGYSSNSSASGSGFIISESGYILTNFHVVENSSSITVSTYDGRDHEATVVGYDEENDVAVLKVEAEGLVPVVLGSSKQLSVGDSVVAIGNPLGELTFSMTQGIVSALDRTVNLSGSQSMTLIQTDCAINSGNSGGALFNLYGEVVGITNAKYCYSSTGATVDNICFAIPIDSVKSIVESIIEKGYASTPYIGLTISPVSEENLAYGLPEGLSVQVIEEDGPAAKAGLQLYDIITSVNGEPAKVNADLVDVVSASKPGDEIKLEVYRKGQTLNLTITVGERIHSQETLQNEQQQQQQEQQQISPYYSDPFGSDPFGGSPFGDIFRFFF